MNFSRLGFRKLRSEDVENLPVKLRNVTSSRIPEDLPIQIKICMHDPMPNRNDLPPRYFRVATSQLSRQPVDGLADHSQMVEDRC